jgi:hypothetical protein
VRCDWTGEGAPANMARTAPIEAAADALALSDAWKAAYVDTGWAARASQPTTNEKN